MTLSEVIDAIRQSNNDVGGRIIEFSGREYYVRGRGYIHDLGAIEKIALRASGPSGTPLLVKDVATVRFGPEIRRGLLEWNGEGEAVGAVVVTRYGENALDVIARIKKKLEELKPSFPDGVELTVAYDRSGLIERSIDTLRHALTEEAIVVSLVILLFLLHFRSSMLPILSLPICVALSFIPMVLLDIPSTIMSLGGLAIAIGATVDAQIVMIEAGHKKLEHAGPGADRHRILIEAAKEVTPAIFFSLLIIAVAFLPVFTLTGQAGRLFKPLAYTKTFMMLISALLSITFAPALQDLFIRGKIKPEKEHPVSRFLIRLYEPFVYVALRRPKSTDRDRSLRPGLRGARGDATRERVHAPAQRGGSALHADHVPEHLDRRGEAAAPVSGPDPSQLPRGRDRVREGRPRRERDRSGPHHHGGDDRAAAPTEGVAEEAPRPLVFELGADLAEAVLPSDLGRGAAPHLGGADHGDEREDAVPGLDQCLDDADQDARRHADDGRSHAYRHQGLRHRSQRGGAGRRFAGAPHGPDQRDSQRPL